jgi:hypothetical protein
MMSMGIKIGVYIAIFVSLAGGYAIWHYKVREGGKEAARIEQERKLNTLKEKTNAAKTDALTADPSDVDMRLYDKYRRKD